MKKLLSILLSVMMVFSLLVPVFAEGEDEGTLTNTETSSETVEAEGQPVLTESAEGNATEATVEGSEPVTTAEETGETVVANEPATFNLTVKTFVRYDGGEYEDFRGDSSLVLNAGEDGSFEHSFRRYDSGEEYLELSKCVLYEKNGDSLTELTEGVSVKKEEQDVFVSWVREDLTVSGDYVLEAYYDQTKVMDHLSVSADNDGEKAMLYFDFEFDNLMDKIISEGYAYYTIGGDESNTKYDLDLSKCELVQSTGDFYWLYGLELGSEMADKFINVKIYLPGYYLYQNGIDCARRYKVYREYYLEDDKSLIEGYNVSVEKYRPGNQVFAWNNYSINNGNAYEVLYVEVEGETLTFEGETSPVSFVMPDHDVTVKSYCKLKEKGLKDDVNFSAGYVEYKGNLVKAVQIGGNPELVKLIHEGAVLNYSTRDSSNHGSYVLRDYNSDRVIFNEYGDSYNEYMYLLDDSFVGTFGFDLKLDGYSRLYCRDVIFEEPHKITFKQYVDGVYVSNYHGYYAEGEYLHVLNTVNGMYTIEYDDGKTSYYVEKVTVSPESSEANLEYNERKTIRDDQVLTRGYYYYEVGNEDATVSLYFKSLNNAYTGGGIDESLSEGVLEAVKSNDVKYIAYGDFEVTQELLDSLDRVDVYANSIDEEYIEEKNEFDAKVAGISGDNKFTGYINVSVCASNGTEELGLIELGELLEFKVVLSDDIYNSIKDKDNIKVLRQHYDLNGNIVYDFLPDSDVKLEGRVLTVRSDKFSVFAVVGYDNPAAVDNGGGQTYQKPVLKPVVNTSVK